MLPELTEYSKNYKLRLKSTSPQYNGNTSLDSITIFPEPRIDNSSAPLCVTENMIFSTYDIPDVTYIWEFENGIKTDSSQYSNKVHWDNVGEYKVTLISEKPVCKDTADKTAWPVFQAGAGGLSEFAGAADVILIPDPLTYRELPWSPGTGWVQCQAYFADGRDIGDHEVLADVADTAEMDASMVTRLLGTDSDVDDIRARDKHSREMGVNSVPTFVVANQHAVPGAQPPELWVQVIADLAAQADAE